MKLEDWLALSPVQRNVIREKWGLYDPLEDGNEPWLELITEAFNRFVLEYSEHPLVNHISYGGPVILVTTALYHPQFIEEIPARYCGFPVEQNPINGIRDDYLRLWHILLSELLNWPESQINEWTLKFDDELNGRVNAWFYHEDEYLYVLPEIVLASGAQVSPPDEYKILNELRKAIEYRASSPIWLSPVDWNAVRSRVNDILIPLDGRLPD